MRLLGLLGTPWQLKIPAALLPGPAWNFRSTFQTQTAHELLDLCLLNRFASAAAGYLLRSFILSFLLLL